MDTPRTRAWLATIVFAIAGACGGLFLAPGSPELVPHALFFCILLVNTFFSIRFYAEIQPRVFSQSLVDTVLAITYVGLGLSIGHPVAFAVAALALFVAAPPKYALMIAHIPHTALLKRKVLIDLVGTVSSAALLIGTLVGYSLIAAWLFAVGFALANVYLLCIQPMYKLE